ncbi:Zinc-type alcohol dehydrogenase-like protein C2E1P3.01-like protein 4 [Phlyctema vagabunda]|uniref:Zinc-type alcohol dehydrogenase-like protein C2E1P3.01-like protein 4 n=1 Tax=Phlyctema vagabunda TaxID=108571 RepID=A0ABR4PJ03_9HELO
MRGVIVPKAGAPFEVVETLEKPEPKKNEILVKSIVTGLNPMENFMQNGLLVEGWPIVLGCDASGVVAEIGEGVAKFKVGDPVFGCSKVGFPGYMTFQEYFLMDEKLAFKRPGHISSESAATTGVASLTASLGLVSGMKLSLSEPKLKSAHSEWIVILGGASSVGQFAIQLSKLNGYTVLASCSPTSNELVRSIGADATLSYKDEFEDQLAQIKSVTKGNFARVYDASAQSSELALKALATTSQASKKYFATTNDWSPMDVSDYDVEVYRIGLGQLGRSGNAFVDKTNSDIIDYIPQLEKLFETGALKPLEYHVAGHGFEGVLEGLEFLNNGDKMGRKIVVRLQDE